MLGITNRRLHRSVLVVRLGFEFHRALFDVKQNKEYSGVKSLMAALALGGKCSLGTAALRFNAFACYICEWLAG
jgi:hypothetical protein